MTLRRFLFVSHRYVGLTLTAFLLIAGVTGCLLVFRTTLDGALNPELFTVADRPTLTALVLVDRVRQAHPDWRVQSFDLNTTPGRAFRLRVAALPRGDQLFVDPADGRVIGMRSSRPGLARAHLFETIYELHYTLLAGRAGRWLMGVVALAWLALNLLGLCVTWPRRGPWIGNWVPAWTTTPEVLSRRPMPELHRLCGLWLLLPLTVLAATSVAMNFYDEIARPLVEVLSPPRPSPYDHPSSYDQQAPPEPGPVVGFAAAEQAAIAANARNTPLLAPVEMTDDPLHDLYAVSFSPGGTALYERFGRVTYAIGRHSGRLAWIDQPRLDGRGRLLLRALYPLHSGQIYGLPSQLLVLVLGLATSGLGITGFLPWWRRHRARTGKIRHKRASGSGSS